VSGNVLVGDVGGTHARFAVVDTAAKPWSISSRLDLDTGFANFTGALRRYLDSVRLASLPSAASIAVAGPVSDGKVTFTNRNWTISESDLRGFGFASALLINDFAALAFAVGNLPPDSIHTIGPELPGMDGEPVTILGAGTGFGASCLARFRGRSVPVATEGGHAGFAPGNDREADVFKVLAHRFGHVSIERVLSGPGIENLYAALAELDGRIAATLAAPDIVARRATDKACGEAVDMFCAIYGSVAGDFALAHGARGGVYIAGGIALKIEQVLEASAFRSRFESKGRMSPYVKAIPTRLILSEDTAFLGAAGASVEYGGG
jgi:glucokinase